jgi:hypothetical protein
MGILMEEEEEEINIYLPEIKKARYGFNGSKGFYEPTDMFPPEEMDEFLLDLWTRSTSKISPYVRKYFPLLKYEKPEGAYINNGKKKKEKINEN